MKKAKLNEKVGKLRSQIMSFANDGIQVSLNIPDTSDVENTFGTVIESVTEQQEEIEGIHTDLETSNVENEDAQKKMLAWTISCVQKLKEENERLQTKLFDANKQIKNLSYNMQGFIDQEAADEAEAMSEPLEFEDIPQFKQRTKLEVEPEPEESSLFATEEGADMGQGGLSITPEIRKFSRYKGPEYKEQVKEMYQSIRPNTLPNDVHARWRWAIRKVMSTQRRQKQKVGLTRARMDSKQTFAGRLDRLEALMLSMQSGLRDQMKEMNKNLNHKIDTSVSRLDREVSNTAGKLDALTEDTDVKFKSVLEEIHMVDATMKEFFEKVQQQSSGDSKVLKDTLKAVEVHLRDQIHLEVDTLRSGVQHITNDLDHAEGTADRLLQKVEALHTLSSTQPVYDAAKPIEQAMSDLTDLLEADTQLREARYELSKLEAGVSSNTRLLAATHNQVKETAKMYNKESTYEGVVELINISQIQEMNNLAESCKGAEGHVKHIESIIAGLNRMCLEHDRVVKDRLKIFSAFSQRVRDLGNKTEELTLGQLDLQNTVAESASRLNITDMPVNSNNNEGGALSKDQLMMLNRFEKDIIELSLRVAMMESFDLEEQEEEEAAQESAATLPFAGAPVEVIPPAFRTELSVKSINVNNLEDPVASATTVDAAMDHADASVLDTTQTTVPTKHAPEPSIPAVLSETAAVMSSGAPAAERASAVASPLSVPAASAPAPSTAPTVAPRKTTTEKRKASTAANLEMLEARLQPLIERIVTSRMEARLQQAGIGEELGFLEEEGEGDLDQEQEGSEGGDQGSPTVIDEQNNKSAAVTEQSRRDPGGGVSMESISAPRSPIKSGPNSFARVRREASRFGGMDSSTKSRASSGKHNTGFDISPYVQDIVAMKRENSKLSKAVGKIEEERISKDDIERMCHHIISTYHANEKKDESNHAIKEMDRRIQSLTKEISGLHSTHNKAITNLQTEFSETLYNVVNTAAESLEEDNKESFVNTRSLCLGCGRSSMVRSQPESRPTSPSFFPQLNSQSSLGPDVYRSGFRMPVKNPLNPTFVLEAAGSQSPGKVRTVKSAGQRMQEALLSSSVDTALTGSSSLVGNSLDAVLPRVKTAVPRPHTSHNPRGRTYTGSSVDIEDEDEVDDQMGLNITTGGTLEDNSHVFTAEDGSMIIQANKGYQLNIGSTTAPIRGTSATMKSVRSGRPEAEEVRPVYRKGLTGKKSLRAETAYAHDRYELDMPNNILLHNNKVSNNAMVRGIEGIMRPYSSQETNRPLRLLPATGGKLHSATMNVSTSSTKF